ncbi:Tol biopolymer transport system component/DNA-binding winged helix-turn-helix (wHTH) protein [Granulicella aggregans]|uniref:Tol biopolymer transport system component/DNA-binding winged helix-turn-helix (WHTH) protein n=1 Tax=Granulicella aggregans TaxID=474949 RepID=A0A7W7ZGE5_9BACT|nr:Tol biopolymer transport system component/DNA-binding winged helix-turn-helix (wHTH) protein [Granulicella aggregans]
MTGEKVDRVVFGNFEADLRSGELWKSGYRIKLPRQPFRVLAALLARPGEVVTREDLQHEVWAANTNVDFDQAIAAAINKIREALGDSAENPRFVQTLTKRGYRFIAPVTLMPEHPISPPADSMPLVIPERISAHDGSENNVEDEPKNLQALPSGSPNAQTGRTQSRPESVPTIEALRTDRTVFEEDLTKGALEDRFNRLDRTKFAYLCLIAISVFACAMIGRWLSIPTPNTTPYRVEQITHYVPISLGPPNPESFLAMAMDGNRVLTPVMVNGRPRLSAIDVDTAEVQGIEVPDEISSNSLADISRDGSRLLLRSQQSTKSEQPLWVVPSVGGSGRRIPGVLAHDAAWMPDGTSILYATGNDLATIGPNEDSSITYAKLPGRAFWLRWSPNGSLLRFTLFDPVTHAAALWELESGSHTPRPVTIPNFISSSACCGVWLPDGQSYVFQSNDNLWQLEGFGRQAKLVQLTNGPLRSLSPVAARNGNRIFFVGLEAPAGLQQFEAERKEFRPAPAFLADANRIDFSRDGRWVAWTDLHEKLWRAHTDGSDKVRLTSDALEVFLAHWSPDGKRLAAMARKPGGVWQIYLVDANGGKAEVLLDEARNAADPSWSNDGGSLVFGREPDLMGKENGSRTIQIINLSTHRVEEIPSSEDLFSPRWSPDGLWIVSLTLDQKNVMLYDVTHQHWQRLVSTSAADPIWSADSKAIYVHAFLADRQPILRVEVPSGGTQIVADLGNLHNGDVANYFFGGITARGEPLVQPRVGTGNLYSLELTKP